MEEEVSPRDKERRSNQQKAKDLKKLGRQKSGSQREFSLDLLPTETLHHLFSFLQVFMTFVIVLIFYHNGNMSIMICDHSDDFNDIDDSDDFNDYVDFQPIDLRSVAQTCSRLCEVSWPLPIIITGLSILYGDIWGDDGPTNSITMSP